MAPLSRGKIGAGGGTQTLRGESRGALSEPSVLPNGSVEEWRWATSQTLRFQQMKVGFPCRWITGGFKTFHRSYSSIMFIHVLSIIFRWFKAPHPGGLKHQTTRCCCDSAGWCSAFAAAGYWAGRQQCAGGGEKGGGAGTLKQTDLIPNWLLDVASGLCDIKVISGDYLLNLMQMVNEYLWISFNDPTRLSSCADSQMFGKYYSVLLYVRRQDHRTSFQGMDRYMIDDQKKTTHYKSSWSKINPFNTQKQYLSIYINILYSL